MFDFFRKLFAKTPAPHTDVTPSQGQVSVPVAPPKSTPLFEPPSKRATTAPLAGRRKLRSTLAVAGGGSERVRGEAFSCFDLAALALRDAFVALTG